MSSLYTLRKIFFYSICLISSVWPGKNRCFAALQSPDSSSLKIDTLFENHSGKDKPGAVVGIIDQGVLVFEKGYGMADLARKTPNGPDLHYKIASVSKQFTAAAMSMLIRQNKLSPEDDIRRYLPEFPDYGKVITIRHLLYHTSGIRDYMVLMWLTGKSFEDRFTNQDAMDIIMRQSSLNFAPATRCVYSNSNYILLAEIIKRSTGISFENYVSQELFKSLQMYNSGFGVPGNGKTLALSYSKAGKKYLSYRNGNQGMGDGGMFTTSHDLVKWDQQFYDTTSITHDLLKKGILDDGNVLSYGRGIMFNRYRGQSIQTHPGAFLGYRAEILRFPEKQISIIVMANSEAINPETISRQIADIYIFKEKIKTNKVKEPLKVTDTSSFKDLSGKYEVAPNVFIDIRETDKQLSGQVSGQPVQPLHFLKSDTYKVGETSDQVIFKRDAAGNVIHLSVVQLQGTTIAKKLEVVSGDLLRAFTGKYYCAELQSAYSFYIRKGALYFKTGTNPPERIKVFKKYDTCYFNYQNLEFATLKFNRDQSNGEITGFLLSSGRISGLKFLKQ